MRTICTQVQHSWEREVPFFSTYALDWIPAANNAAGEYQSRDLLVFARLTRNYYTAKPITYGRLALQFPPSIYLLLLTHYLTQPNHRFLPVIIRGYHRRCGALARADRLKAAVTSSCKASNSAPLLAWIARSTASRAMHSLACLFRSARSR